jgi:hypothetical protein
MNGELIRLLVKESAVAEIRATEQGTGARFPRTTTEGEYSGIVLTHSQWGVCQIFLKSLNATFPTTQLLPNNEILVVSPRCKRRTDGTHDLNARVYDSDGKLKHELLLGDGIEKVQTDPLGNIWVAYFDEGVFGNFGWSTPVGSSGLCCFDGKGTRLWEFDPPSGFTDIVDCYALNVAKDGVWAYYYTDFPIARIDPERKVRAWKTNTSGAREMAVCGSTVLLYGGYQEHRTDCQFVELVGDSANSAGQVALDLPETIRLEESTVIGRDTELHVVSQGHWYRFSLRDLSR